MKRYKEEEAKKSIKWIFENSGKPVTEARELIQILFREQRERIEEEIQKIDDDERYHYPPADIFINAPLALIQTALSEKMNLLKKLYREIEE